MQGSTFMRMETMADQWLKMLICVLALWAAQVHGSNVVDQMTLLDSASAVSKGAVCLDGSPPAYFHSKGFGEGANNWLVFLEGGAWCYYKEHCAWRSNGEQGSSTKMSKIQNFTGILTNSSTTNPDFYNWNIVYVKYCDGGSFAGEIEQVLSVYTTDYAGENYKLYNVTIRGARIFEAVVEDLLAKGMNNADNAMLGGCSAGGLATLIHCDTFRTLLPNARRVKCLSDAGFFVHGKDMPANLTGRENYYHDVAQIHGIKKDLPEACTSKMEPHLCLFPENLLQYIKTPVFILQSAFDSYQLLSPFLRNESGWLDCVNFGGNCTPDMIQYKLDFRGELLKELPKGDCASRGIYVANNPHHGIATYEEEWNGLLSPIVNKKTPATAVGNWYFDRDCSEDIEEANDIPYAPPPSSYQYL